MARGAQKAKPSPTTIITNLLLLAHVIVLGTNEGIKCLDAIEPIVLMCNMTMLACKQVKDEPTIEEVGLIEKSSRI